MKAAALVEYFKPLSLMDLPKPKVESPYDIIVRIAGAGVCRTDLHIQEGVWKDIFSPKLPYVLGHENTGYVEEVGSAVDWLEPGDPVILHPFITCRHCRACRAGNDMHCTNGKFPGLDGTNGGFAEYLKTSAFSAIKLSKGVDPVPMAPLADAGLTAYHAVKKVASSLYPGTFAVVIGVGGLGHISIQVLKALTPAKVIAVDVSDERINFAKNIGADHGVLSRDAVNEVMKITDNVGADVVLDFVGEYGTPETSLKMVRKGGIYSIIGYGGELKNLTVDFIIRELTVVGNLVGTYNELAELVNLYNQGKVRLNVQRFPLSQVNDVLEMLKNGKVLGRAVLEPVE